MAPLLATNARPLARSKAPMVTALVRQNGVLTIGDVLMLELPHYSPETREEIAWEFTSYCPGPFQFWNIPEDGNTPMECFRKQLRDFREGRFVDDTA